MAKIRIWTIIAVLIIAVSAGASASIYPTFSLPGCAPNFDVNITGGFEVYPDSIAEIEVTIWNVRCGLSHAALYVSGLDEFTYQKSPEFFSSVTYFEPKTFRIDIIIPEDTEPRTRVIGLVVMSNEKRVETEIELSIVSRPPPEPEPEPKEIEEPKIVYVESAPEQEPVEFIDLNELLMKLTTTV